MEGVVHQHVEPTLLALDALEERLHLGVVAVIAGCGDAPPPRRRHLLGGGAHGPRQRRVALAHAAPGDVDAGSGRA